MEETRTPGLLIRSARRAIPSIFGSYVLTPFIGDTSQVLNFEFLHPLSDFATICTLCTFMTMTKLLSCRYNMDTNRVEALFADGTTVVIDCITVEDEYGNTPAQRAELDWLLYNKPLEYAQMVLRGEMEHYLSLGCDHGRLED